MRVKERLWRWLLLLQLPWDPQVSIVIVDSFPLYLCQFARAKRCRRFFGEAAFGRDELIKQTFYLHLPLPLASAHQLARGDYRSGLGSSQCLGQGDGWGSVCWQGPAVGHWGIATADY